VASNRGMHGEIDVVCVKYRAAMFAVLGLTSPAAAQQGATPPAPGPSAGQDIVVTAPGERGAVIGRTPPDIRLDRDDIATYGAGNVGELLQSLSPQTGQRPVILVNGRRIAGVQDLNRLPPEAIARVEILPPEVALAYGYPADQRVVNIVLETRFRAVTGEVGALAATESGRGSQNARLNATWIDGDSRSSLDLEYDRDTALTEDERRLGAIDASLFDPRGNITAAIPGSEIDPALSALAGTQVTLAAVPASAGAAPPGLADFVAGANAPNEADAGRYRTLLPAGHKLTVGGALGRRLSSAITGTLTARLELGESDSRLGLGGAALTLPAGNPFSPFGRDVTLWRSFDAPGALTGGSQSRLANVSMAVNGRSGPWTWFASASYENSYSDNVVDAGIDASGLQSRLDAGDPGLNPYGPLPATATPVTALSTTSRQSIATAQVTAMAPVMRVPAGNVMTTFSAGFSSGDIDNRTRGIGLAEDTRLSSDQAQGRVNLAIPLTSRRRGVLASLGDLSAIFGLARERLAGVGDATTLTYGLTWSPARALRMALVATDAQGLPPAVQRNAPILATPNVPFFDAVTGQTVDVIRIDGGNPNLEADRHHLISFNGSWRPFPALNLSLNAAYTLNRTDGGIGALTLVTPQVEAAFPDRFERDASGRLVRVDLRPVNFAHANTSQLSWGLSFSMPVGGGHAEAAPPPDETVVPPQLAGPGDGPQAGMPLGPAPRRGMRVTRPRLLLSLNHSWRIRDALTIADGLAPIDQLDAATVTGRGPARHRIDARANLSMNGLGAALSAIWESGGTRGEGASRLDFSDLTTVNLNLFADLDRLGGGNDPLLHGARISFEVANLFDSRLDVRDAFGTTPLAFAPDRIDPLGRTVRLTLRKQI
jgi:iron complex outermembrane receptor protein